MHGLSKKLSSISQIVKNTLHIKDKSDPKSSRKSTKHSSTGLDLETPNDFFIALASSEKSDLYSHIKRNFSRIYSFVDLVQYEANKSCKLKFKVKNYDPSKYAVEELVITPIEPKRRKDGLFQKHHKIILYSDSAPLEEDSVRVGVTGKTIELRNLFLVSKSKRYEKLRLHFQLKIKDFPTVVRVTNKFTIGIEIRTADTLVYDDFTDLKVPKASNASEQRKPSDDSVASSINPPSDKSLLGEVNRGYSDTIASYMKLDDAVAVDDKRPPLTADEDTKKVNGLETHAGSNAKEKPSNATALSNRPSVSPSTHAKHHDKHDKHEKDDKHDGKHGKHHKHSRASSVKDGRHASTASSVQSGSAHPLMASKSANTLEVPKVSKRSSYGSKHDDEKGDLKIQKAQKLKSRLEPSNNNGQGRTRSASLNADSTKDTKDPRSRPTITHHQNKFANRQISNHIMTRLQ